MVLKAYSLEYKSSAKRFQQKKKEWKRMTFSNMDLKYEVFRAILGSGSKQKGDMTKIECQIIELN
ncbi:MAG: hypothetical protein ACI9DJ_001242 [Algoriphagus sp.]|jgi:hypothetical protein